MTTHQHIPEASAVNVAQIRGSQILAKCQECGRSIHTKLFQANIGKGPEWREVVIKERYALVLVTTELDYLTSDGEETEESGWDIIKESLTEHMRRFAKTSFSSRSSRFIEWEESDA